MNDDEMLAAMRNSLAGVKDSLTDARMDRPVSAITGRARDRRLRRGLTGAAAAGLALTVPGGSATARSVHVNLDAWSVNTTSAGLVDVDIRELHDPAALRRTLAEAGVPAVVAFGEFCTSRSSFPPTQVLGKARGGDHALLTINPAAMPARTELTIGIMSMRSSSGAKQGFAVAFGLVKQGSHLTCSAQPIGPG